MPQSIGKAEVIANNLIRIRKVTGIPYIGFFFVNGATTDPVSTSTVYAYNYSGGQIRSLIASLEIPNLHTVQGYSICVISFSPLCICFRNDFNRLHVWNVDSNTVNYYDLPDVPSSIAHGADGFGYFFIKNGPDEYALYKVDAACAITQLNIGNEVMDIFPNGTPGNICFYDGATAFSVVYGDPGDAGIIQILNGAKPILIPSDTAFPGDPAAGDWLSFFGGHRITSYEEAVAFNIDTNQVCGFWSEPNSEELIADLGRGVSDIHPNAAGDKYCIYSYSPAAVGLANIGQSPSVFDEVPGDGPDNRTPDYMISL